MVLGSERSRPQFDIRGKIACDAEAIGWLASGYAVSAALFSAVELGVFDRLKEEPRTVSALAEVLDTSIDGLERLLVLLHALGLVDRDGDQRYHNAPVAAHLLVRTAEPSLWPLLLHQQRHAYTLFGHLSDAIRSGEPQTFHWPFAGASARVDGSDTYDLLSRSPAEYRLFLAGMDAAATGLGDVIAAQVSFEHVRRLADFGGGGGGVAIALARAVPELEVVIVDRNEACRVADERVAAAGLAERIHTLEGDFREPLPALGTVDAVLLGGVLADWDEADRRRLLATACHALRPGGQVIVSEPLLDDDNEGPVFPAIVSLMMLLGTRGRAFRARDLEAELRDAGFEEIAVHRNKKLGVRDVVVAKRPAH